MGWTVLYIAFGVVALWLLGEVLLQYKARLRWRLLAFSGFLCVVLGVLIPSVLVIALGAIAFAVGQTYVTLSFRRGFSTGWAIGGSPGASRRRRGRQPSAKEEPVLEVSGLEYEEPAAPAEDDPAAVYEPQPMPEETGQYGVYSPSPYAQPGGGQGYQEQEQQPAGAQPQYAAHDTYGGYGEPAENSSYNGGYAYGTDQHSYAAYSDPYIGTGGTAAPPYASYDAYGNGNGYDAGSGGGYDGYANQQQFTEPYSAPQYGADTPPGGVWVPQQREGEQYPQGTPAPYGSGYPAGDEGYGNGGYGNDTGQNEQYRY
ncbi:hypothetical protein [Streptomyces sp. NPDC060198]|uniref:hypothetical protein n=1 Tax=Streptomyces sp. NPDC060198 TaxID=3347070 RepID=UPI003651E274